MFFEIMRKSMQPHRVRFSMFPRIRASNLRVSVCPPPPPPPPCREPVKPVVMGLPDLSVPFVASERHSSRVGACSACTLLLAFGVLCAGPAEVQAQEVVTLISTLGQSDTTSVAQRVTSQAFTTGGNAVGYRLESITLSLGNHRINRGVSIRIFRP